MDLPLKNSSRCWTQSKGNRVRDGKERAHMWLNQGVRNAEDVPTYSLHPKKTVIIRLGEETKVRVKLHKCPQKYSVRSTVL